MGYIIKDTITDLENRDKPQTFYSGIDGYVHGYPEYAEPYKTEKGAYNKIQREMEWVGFIEKINDYESIENKRWKHHYEIVKVGA